MALTGVVRDGDADICLVSSLDLGGVPKLDAGVVAVRISLALVLFSPLKVSGVVGVSFIKALSIFCIKKINYAILTEVSLF